jgi:hypothetical protein
MRRKGTPERSKISRTGTVAYARKQTKSGGDGDEPADPAAPTKAFDVTDTSAAIPKPKLETPAPGDGPKSATSNAPPVPPAPPAPPAPVVAATGDAAREDPANRPTIKMPEIASPGAPQPGDGPKSATHNEPPTEIVPPARSEGAPWPEATPQPMAPVEQPARARAKTGPMPVTAIGLPPEVPAPAPAAKPDTRLVEDPTSMPGPREIPGGSPDDPAAPPGHVPPGDSRSFRRGNEFALVYRTGSCVISRVGVVGTRGQWRVVDYPTYSAAGNAYAKECSRFVSDGFSDYRD